MKRELHAVILLLVGGVLLRLAITGDHVNYVRAGLQPILLAAGGVLVVVAVVSLWPALTGRTGRAGSPKNDPGHGHHADHRPEADHGPQADRRPQADHRPEADHRPQADHGHDHGRFDTAWLLLVPVLVLLLIAPKALGSYSAARSGTALSSVREQSELPPLPDGDPVRITLLEYASRAVFDQGRSLADRQVTLSGFLLPGDGADWYLARMVIGCCAADAQPVKIGLVGRVPDGARANQWLQVTGHYLARTSKDPVNGETIPYLQVVAASEIQAPAQPYVS